MSLKEAKHKKKINIREIGSTILHKLPRKLWLFGLAGLICLLLTGLMLLTEAGLKKNLTDQQMASRWSDKKDTAQISCFFAEGEVASGDYFMGVAQSVDTALKEASLEAPAENARLWIAGISRSGKLAVTSAQATVELETIGVSGDFFQFHPLQLKFGSFFSDDSMMNDGIVIDEDTAWQLFGSSDVAGMQVTIGGVPHFVTGVVERQEGRLAEAAGLEKSICYVSMDSLEKYGMTTGGFTYEIVLPNPIQGFALGVMNTAVNAETTEVSVVENQTRFDILPLLDVAKSFGIRSMSKRGIVYPYWENIARAYEDILAVTLIVKILLLTVLVIWIFVTVIYLLKHKSWNAASLTRWSKDKIYEMQAKRYHKKNSSIRKEAEIQTEEIEIGIEEAEIQQAEIENQTEAAELIIEETEIHTESGGKAL